MKKLLFLVFIFFFSVPVYAAPVTFVRTTDDLRLPTNIDTSKVNINDVLKTPSVDASAKIYDLADLLTDAEESKIYIELNEYIHNTGLDAFIVTTNNLNGYSMKDYTNNFYDYNNFGEDGVAFVIYVGSDRTSIYMGNSGVPTSEVYTAYSDNVIIEVSKYVYDNHIAKKDYLGACETYIKLIDGFYVKAYGDHRVGEKITIDANIPWFIISVVSAVLTFIIMGLVFTKYQKPKRMIDISLKSSIDFSTMVVKCEYDRPVTNKNT